MTIAHGDTYVFYSSLKVCLKELDDLIQSGKLQIEDVQRTYAELSCMKAVLERSK